MRVEDRVALRIIQLFAEGKNAAEVARVLGYTSHQSVGQYMRRRGYQWDPRLRNYVKIGGDGGGQEEPGFPGPDLAGIPEGFANSEAVQELLRRAPDVLELLRHRVKPVTSLGLRLREKSKPYVCKSFCLSMDLDRRLKEFCAAHGIRQRDVIETAVWEFLESRSGVEG